MNLLQIKQKMIDLAISDTFMANACGVGKYYFNECLKGKSKKHIMTKKLEQKIEGVFKAIEIKKHKEERERQEQQKAIAAEQPAQKQVLSAPLFLTKNSIAYDRGVLQGIKIARKSVVDAINSGANPDSVITILFALSSETDKIIEKLFGTNEEK